MQIRKTLYIPLLVFTLSQQSLTATLLPDFFSTLYQEHRKSFQTIYSTYLIKSLQEINIDSKSNGIQDMILPLIFYHSLFTSKEAVDCSKGGILEIPYFWHWIKPNPRYSLVYLPDQKSLFEVKPPKGYEKYKSYADIDRTPYIYFSNLVSDSALFYHPGCGDIYTFGWCSEREMAFSSLISILGYKSKIKQSGIHVWSEILLEVNSDKGIQNIIISIDNTFNQIGFEILSVPKSKWETDFGEGAQVAWYNKKALSQTELQLIKSIQVNDKAKFRINKKINEWLAKK